MTTQKILVSLRIDAVNIDKADTLAISEDRSRNYIINRLLHAKLKFVEKKHGEIIVKTGQLEKFRSKRRSKNKHPDKKNTEKADRSRPDGLHEPNDETKRL